MRTDRSVGLEEKDLALEKDKTDMFKGASFSGHERDCLFLNHEGKEFSDVSAVGGVDHPGDGRATALLDFDRDGWIDMATAHHNSPEFILYRNRLGDPSTGSGRTGRGAERGRFLAIRFEGGNRTAEPAALSPRDGFGAKVRIELPDGRKLLREHRCGEGFAGQNSTTMLVGLGASETVRKLRVEWPSGRAHEVENVPAGTLLTAWEAPEQAPGGKAFAQEAYAKPAAARQAQGEREGSKDRFLVAGADASAKLRMYTTTATWCGSCKKELPHLARLRQRFPEASLAMFGVPVSDRDDRAKLAAYEQAQKPAYTLLLEIDRAEAARVNKLALDAAGATDALPVTVVTDADGRVVFARTGVPTVSDIESLLE